MEMQRQQAVASTLGPQLKSVPEQGVKMQEPEPAGPNPWQGAVEGPGVASVVGATEEFWAGNAPWHTKEEPDEGLQKRWDAQLQEFVKTLESPHLERGHPQLQWPMSGNDSEAFLAPSEGSGATTQQHRQEGVTKLLGLNRASPLTDGIPLVKPEVEDDVKMKEKHPDEEASSLDVQRKRFRQFCYKDAEGPREACVHLQERCRQWLKPERHTKERILELLVLEQFLNILPEEMQNWVRELSPENCTQAVALVESFLLRQQEEKRHENQVPGTLKEEPMDFSKPEEAPLDTRPVVKIKQENWRESSSLTDDESLCGKGKMQPGNPGRKQRGGMPSGGAEQDFPRSPDRGDASESQTKEQAEKEKENAAHSEGGKGVDKNAALQRIQTGKKGKVCFHCGKVFKRGDELAEHERSHTGEKPFECPACEKSFGSKRHLKRHQTIHTGQKRYKCTDCGKGFNCNSRLTTHKRYHTGERPYSCFKCGKSFSDRYVFLKHEVIHSGDKPYKCLDCGKSFFRSSHFNEHKRIHTKEKPHHCFDCGKSFSRKSSLRIHTRIHTGEKPYQCEECEKPFNNYSNFQTHKKIHAREKQNRELPLPT